MIIACETNYSVKISKYYILFEWHDVLKTCQTLLTYAHSGLQHDAIDRATVLSLRAWRIIMLFKRIRDITEHKTGLKSVADTIVIRN